MDKSLPIGFVLVDHFRIDGVLGQGGFGTTYLAHDTQLDCPVAIKEYNPDFATRRTNFTISPRTESDRDSYQWGYNSFLKEAQLLAKFHHPNIVKVRHIFKEHETAYIVMDYEQGESLLERFREGGNIVDAAELLRIIEPVIEGLKTVHQRGFLHRDIKPHNIFIRDDGTPLLLDFGSARIQGADATRTVTPGYTPIEQFEDVGFEGPFTDIYALGATLYQIITGKPPISALKRQVRLVHNEKDPYIPLVAADINGPEGPRLVSAINAALIQDAESRPQSLDEWSLLGGVEQLDPEPLDNDKPPMWLGALAAVAGIACLSVAALWAVKSGVFDFDRANPTGEPISTIGSQADDVSPDSNIKAPADDATAAAVDKPSRDDSGSRLNANADQVASSDTRAQLGTQADGQADGQLSDAADAQADEAVNNDQAREAALTTQQPRAASAAKDAQQTQAVVDRLAGPATTGDDTVESLKDKPELASAPIKPAVTSQPTTDAKPSKAAAEKAEVAALKGEFDTFKQSLFDDRKAHGGKGQDVKLATGLGLLERVALHSANRDWLENEYLSLMNEMTSAPAYTLSTNRAGTGTAMDVMESAATAGVSGTFMGKSSDAIGTAYSALVENNNSHTKRRQYLDSWAGTLNSIEQMAQDKGLSADMDLSAERLQISDYYRQFSGGNDTESDQYMDQWKEFLASFGSASQPWLNTANAQLAQQEQATAGCKSTINTVFRYSKIMGIGDKFSTYKFPRRKADEFTTLVSQLQEFCDVQCVDVWGKSSRIRGDLIKRLKKNGISADRYRQRSNGFSMDYEYVQVYAVDSRC